VRFALLWCPAQESPERRAARESARACRCVCSSDTSRNRFVMAESGWADIASARPCAQSMESRRARHASRRLLGQRSLAPAVRSKCLVRSHSTSDNRSIPYRQRALLFAASMKKGAANGASSIVRVLLAALEAMTQTCGHSNLLVVARSGQTVDVGIDDGVFVDLLIFALQVHVGTLGQCVRVPARLARVYVYEPAMLTAGVRA
jgi:hypothetical protein